MGPPNRSVANVRGQAEIALTPRKGCISVWNWAAEAFSPTLRAADKE